MQPERRAKVRILFSIRLMGALLQDSHIKLKICRLYWEEKLTGLNMGEYSKNPYIRTLNFEGKAAIGSYLMITISEIRMLGS